jgi:hypothetical protein
MRWLAVLAVATLAAPAFPRADDARVRETARKVLSRYGPALVVVRQTIKTRVVYEGRERVGDERTMELSGTMVSPDGLTVLSDFTSNPEAIFQREDGPRMETETTDVKLVLRDGRELPARFVLRDPDLDLAFVAPIEPVPALPCVRFAKVAVPATLDDLVYLGQLGKSLDRAVAVATGRVRAVVTKPRVFVVPNPMDGQLFLGGPAFDDRGRPVGLVVVRRLPTTPESFNSFRDVMEAMTAVVLTAADVQDAAAQAAAARTKAGSQPQAPAAAQPEAPAPAVP